MDWQDSLANHGYADFETKAAHWLNSAELYFVNAESILRDLNKKFIDGIVGGKDRGTPMGALNMSFNLVKEDFPVKWWGAVSEAMQVAANPLTRLQQAAGTTSASISPADSPPKPKKKRDRERREREHERGTGSDGKCVKCGESVVTGDTLKDPKQRYEAFKAHNNHCKKRADK